MIIWLAFCDCLFLSGVCGIVVHASSVCPLMNEDTTVKGSHKIDGKDARWGTIDEYIYVCVCVYLSSPILEYNSECLNDGELLISSSIWRNVCFCIPDVQQSLSSILVQRTELYEWDTADVSIALRGFIFSKRRLKTNVSGKKTLMRQQV